jgi:hypothetical protein
MSVEGTHVYQVKRIFGPDDGTFQPADLEGDNYFLRGYWQLSEGHGVSAFAYILDIDDDEKYAPGKSVDSSTQKVGRRPGSAGQSSAELVRAVA